MQAYLREPREEEFPDLEKEFAPNLLNSTVYIISMFLQVGSTAGHPSLVRLLSFLAIFVKTPGKKFQLVFCSLLIFRRMFVFFHLIKLQ